MGIKIPVNLHRRGFSNVFNYFGYIPDPQSHHYLLIEPQHCLHENALLLGVVTTVVKLPSLILTKFPYINILYKGVFDDTQ